MKDTLYTIHFVHIRSGQWPRLHKLYRTAENATNPPFGLSENMVPQSPVF